MTQYFRRDLQVALGWTAPHFEANFTELKVSMANIDVEIYCAEVDQYSTRGSLDLFLKNTMYWNALEPSAQQDPEAKQKVKNAVSYRLLAPYRVVSVGLF